MLRHCADEQVRCLFYISFKEALTGCFVSSTSLDHVQSAASQSSREAAGKAHDLYTEEASKEREKAMSMGINVGV